MCKSCQFAVGWHLCSKAADGIHRWRRGSLFAGVLDIQRALWNLHRRMVPLDILRSKAQEYVEASLVDEAAARVMVQAIGDSEKST